MYAVDHGASVACITAEDGHRCDHCTKDIYNGFTYWYSAFDTPREIRDAFLADMTWSRN
jgi:hypothetical protein